MELAAIGLSIVSLVTSCLSWVYAVRTHREPMPDSSQTMARMAEMEVEWASTLEMLNKQLKKLSKRDRDALAARQKDDVEQVDTGVPTSKDDLRRIARARGMRV